MTAATATASTSPTHPANHHLPNASHQHNQPHPTASSQQHTHSKAHTNVSKVNSGAPAPSSARSVRDLARRLEERKTPPYAPMYPSLQRHHPPESNTQQQQQQQRHSLSSNNDASSRSFSHSSLPSRHHGRADPSLPLELPRKYDADEELARRLQREEQEAAEKRRKEREDSERWRKRMESEEEDARIARLLQEAEERAAEEEQARVEAGRLEEAELEARRLREEEEQARQAAIDADAELARRMQEEEEHAAQTAHASQRVEPISVRAPSLHPAMHSSLPPSTPSPVDPFLPPTVVSPFAPPAGIGHESRERIRREIARSRAESERMRAAIPQRREASTASTIPSAASGGMVHPLPPASTLTPSRTSSSQPRSREQIIQRLRDMQGVYVDDGWEPIPPHLLHPSTSPSSTSSSSSGSMRHGPPPRATSIHFRPDGRMVVGWADEPDEATAAAIDTAATDGIDGLHLSSSSQQSEQRHQPQPPSRDEWRREQARRMAEERDEQERADARYAQRLQQQNAELDSSVGGFDHLSFGSMLGGLLRHVLLGSNRSGSGGGLTGSSSTYSSSASQPVRWQFSYGPMVWDDLSPYSHQPAGRSGVASIDLDRMSYDDLLALEEMMGSVKPKVKAANREQIDALPVHQFKKPNKHKQHEGGDRPMTGNNSSSSSSSSSSSLPSAIEQRQRSQSNVTPDCAICLEAFNEGDEIKTLPCFHSFHAPEIDQWLHTNERCPICQTPATVTVKEQT